MNISQFKDLLAKFLDRSIEPDQERVLEEYDKRMLSKFFQEKKWGTKQRGKVHKSILKTLPNQKEETISLFSTIKVAATIVLLLGLGFVTYYTLDKQNRSHSTIQIVKTTEWGQKMDVVLADGSKVKLNSGSTIKFPAIFDDSIREVELIGEAFFDVAKNPNKPFVINTGKLKTTVLGTSFNVNAYPEEEKISVTVSSGKVKIQSESNEVLLTPNEQGIFYKSFNTISKGTIDTTAYLEWKDGVLRFEDNTLAEATTKLSRWFNVKFEFENEAIKQCRFTGKFNGDGLQTILEGLVFVKEGLAYRMEGNNLIVLSGKCDN